MHRSRLLRVEGGYAWREIMMCYTLLSPVAGGDVPRGRGHRLATLLARLVAALSCRRRRFTLRAIIILLVIAVLAYVARRIWLSIIQLRVGAIPDDVDVPEVSMEPDRGWQVTRRVRGGVATIDVTHPVEGVARTWTVPLREPGAQRTLEDAMRRAGLLVRDLSST